MGRCYGSLGVAIDRPSTTSWSRRAMSGHRRRRPGADPRRAFGASATHYRVEPRVTIEVRESIPPARRPRLGYAARAGHRPGLGDDLRHRRGRAGCRRGHGQRAPLGHRNGDVPDGRLPHRRRTQEGAVWPGRDADGRVAPRFPGGLALCRGRSRLAWRSQWAQRRGGLWSIGAVGADLRGGVQDHSAPD